MKEYAIKLVKNYCQVFRELCEENPENAYSYYAIEINKLRGVLDMLALDDTMCYKEYKEISKQLRGMLDNVLKEFVQA